MKAAVLHALGTVPTYETFPDPAPQSEAELLLVVTAAALKNLDKGRASGMHYARYHALPAVVGFDGVGRLADGTRVYAQGLTGMLAEKALIQPGSYTVLPAGLDEATATALPNAVAGAALALRFRAQVRPGEVVLINGATGVTGQLAVQLAKYYGAATIIATGRNPAALARAQALGGRRSRVVVAARSGPAGAATAPPRRHAHRRSARLPVRPARGVAARGPAGRRPARGHAPGAPGHGGQHGRRNDSTPVPVLAQRGHRGARLGLRQPLASRAGQFHHEVLPEMFALAAQGRLSIATLTTDLASIATAWT